MILVENPWFFPGGVQAFQVKGKPYETRQRNYRPEQFMQMPKWEDYRLDTVRPSERINEGGRTDGCKALV